MPGRLDPRTDILPKAQQEIWPLLAPAPRLSFVLYGGTAVALHLGHRTSIDFDFFRSAPLDKKELEASFTFMRDAQTIQENENTRVVNVTMPSGPVKVSFFGGIAIGRINEPLQTGDSTLLVASLEDLLATKLKATLDRAEAKDYRDISAMLSAGTSLQRGLGAFANVPQRSRACSAGNRLLQGRRFAVASQERSERASRRARPRVGDSRNNHSRRVACSFVAQIER
jgi:hypothetical protein